MKNKKHLALYMNIADQVAEMSSAVRLKVGTVVVKDNNIIGFGWNGTPAGWDNTCEDIIYMPDRNSEGVADMSEQAVEEFWPLCEMSTNSDGTRINRRYRLKTKPETLHSEANCLMKITRSTESSEGASLVCTHAPCHDCAKLIYQAGISSVYYRNSYRESTGIEFLKECGVTVEQYIDSRE